MHAENRKSLKSDKNWLAQQFVKWDRTVRIVLNFIQAETKNPQEGLLVIELVRAYLKKNYDLEKFCDLLEPEKLARLVKQEEEPEDGHQAET